MPNSIFLNAANTFAFIGIGTTPLASAGIFIQNSTLQIGVRIEPTGADAHQPMLLFQRSNGTVTGMIDEIGTFRTNLSVSISGAMTCTLNADGSILSRSSGVTGLSDMLDVVGDTTYGIVSKASSVPGQIYTGLDKDANYVFNVNPTGHVQFGAGNSLASMDTNLSRLSAGVLAVGNGTASDSSGTIKGLFQNNAATITATAATTASFLTNGVGGTGGPTTGAQNGWIVIKDSAGASTWVPVWK